MSDAEKAIPKDAEESTETTPLVASKPVSQDGRTTEWIMIGLMLVTLIVVGVVQVKLIEGWSTLTAVYVIVQIVTTIGYGDFTVTSDMMKLFCAFYVILMLIFGAYVFNIITQWVQDRGMSIAREKLKRLNELSHSKKELKKIDKDTSQFMAASALAVFAIAFGTVFFATYEACTCSYGKSYVDGCKQDTLELCMETGGYQKSWTACFYMSVITLTTVGFGDHSPRSWVGRLVGIVWMLIGVSFVANWFATLSRMFFLLDQKKKLKVQATMDEETFKKIDKDGNGGLSRSEFRSYFLIKNGLATEEDINAIDAEFDRILRKDLDTKHVTFQMVKASERDDEA